MWADGSEEHGRNRRMNDRTSGSEGVCGAARWCADDEPVSHHPREKAATRPVMTPDDEVGQLVLRPLVNDDLVQRDHRCRKISVVALSGFIASTSIFSTPNDSRIDTGPQRKDRTLRNKSPKCVAES